jgi:hypothetical protein
MQQAYGNITIKVPEIDERLSVEELLNSDNGKLEELISTIVSIFNFFLKNHLLRSFWM